MVTSAGFEPATYGLEVRCSIQLSYEALGAKGARHCAYSMSPKSGYRFWDKDMRRNND